MKPSCCSYVLGAVVSQYLYSDAQECNYNMHYIEECMNQIRLGWVGEVILRLKLLLYELT